MRPLHDKFIKKKKYIRSNKRQEVVKEMYLFLAITSSQHGQVGMPVGELRPTRGEGHF